MSENEEKEKIKNIAKLRALLEKRVKAMEEELDEMKTLLDLIDTILLKEGFKRAEISKPIQSPQKQEATKPSDVLQKRGVPLKTVTGDLLAQLYTEKDSMQIVLAEDKNFDINTPPFTSFFVERVLAKMEEKDKGDVKEGKLAPGNILTFSMKQEGNVIREITINNLRRERSRELKSSLRWTLEKMYERMKQKN